MDFINISICIGIALIILLLICNHQKANHFESLPGPKGVLIAGNFFELSKGKPFLLLHGWAKKYGTIFKMNMFGLPIIVVNGAEEIYEVYIKKGQEFAGRPYRYVAYKEMGEYSAFALDTAGLTHKNAFIKKLMLKHMKAYGTGLNDLAKRVTSITQETIEELKLRNSATPLSMIDILLKCIGTIAFEHILGYRPDEEDMSKISILQDHHAHVQALGGVGASLDMFPILRFFGHPTWKRIVDVKKVLNQCMTKWKAKVYQEEAQGMDLSRNYIHVMLQEKRKGTFDITEKNVDYNMMDMIAAGIMTSHASMVGFFSVLVHYPRVQKKLHDEVDRELQGGNPTFDDRNHMHYTYATLLELFRYTLVAPFGVPHATTCDTNIKDIKIPKGTMIWINVWGLANDEKIWGDPFVFRPERFLMDDGTLVPADHYTRRCVLPFGAGPRVCPGEVFSVSRLFIIIAMFMQAFEVLPATTIEEQPTCDWREAETGVVLHPKPYKIRLQPRKLHRGSSSNQA